MYRYRPKRRGILIIDDYPNSINALQDVLKEAGYDVECVSCGRKAIDRLLDHKFNIILCSNCLPDTEPTRLCEKIKKMNPATVILLIRDMGDIETIASLKTYGVNEVLNKPLNIDHLIGTINKAECQLN